MQSQALLLCLTASVAVPAVGRQGEAGSCLLLCAAEAVGCSVRPTEVRPAALTVTGLNAVASHHAAASAAYSPGRVPAGHHAVLEGCCGTQRQKRWAWLLGLGRALRLTVRG